MTKLMKKIILFVFSSILLMALSLPGMCQATFGKMELDGVYFEGQYRYHYIYIPTKLRAERPLVIVLHGYGQNAYRYVPEMLEVAEREGFAVCYPQGLRAPLTGSAGWYIGYPVQRGMRQNDDDFICYLSKSLCKKYNLYNAFLTGMSNGGDMCYLIGRKHAGEFRAIASVAGQTMKWIDDTVPFSGPVPFMEIHGTADRAARWEGDITGSAGWGAYLSVPTAIKYWVQQNGCNPQKTVTRLPRKSRGSHQVILHKWQGGSPAWGGVHPVWHWGRPEWEKGHPCEVLLYEIKDGNHSWALADMDTCTLIWDFFKQYLYPPLPIVSISEQTSPKANK